MSKETTLILVKPDGVQRGLVGEIVHRIERTGLKITGMKMMQVSSTIAQQHYAEHKGKPFYNGLISFITSSPIVAIAASGENAIRIVRNLIGETAPVNAQPGTIRADFAVEIGRNLVHGSASSEDAERELKIFFDDKEIVDYPRSIESWISEE